MWAARVHAVAAVLWVLVAVASTSTKTTVHVQPIDPSMDLLEYLVEGQTKDLHPILDRKHKDKASAEDIFQAFMVVKNVIGFLLMFVSPVIQVKGFGLQVINTVINIARFIFMIHSSKSSHHQIHLTEQPHGHDVQTTSYQTYSHDVQPVHFDHSQSYSNDWAQPAQAQSYSNDIQPGHLQPYSYESPIINDHTTLSASGSRRYFTRMPSSKNGPYPYKKPGSTTFR